MIRRKATEHRRDGRSDRGAFLCFRFLVDRLDESGNPGRLD
jgi:hypothetical protein